MSDSTPVTDKPAKKKTSPLLAALIVLLALVLFGVAVVYAGGIDFITGLFGGGQPVATTPTTPTKPAAPAAPAVSTSSSVESTLVATATGVVDPEAAKRMFYEQVASRETITELADGKFASFTFGAPTGTADEQTLPVTATYKSGGSFSGRMVLKRYSGSWFFAAIARDENPIDITKPPIPVNVAIMNAIVDGQLAEQTIVSGAAAGSFSSMTLEAPTGGAGTKSIAVSLTGRGSATGRIVCVSKVISGKTYWFITSFSK